MNENVPQLSNGNEWEELIRFAGEEHKIPRPNILICGYTGSGKSSLIKTLLGNVVPADKIADGAPKTQGFDCYETPLVRIYDSKGMENGDSEETFKSTIKNFIRKLQEKDPNDVFKHIHLIWYTIQACGARVTNTDCELIQKIFNPNDVIVCLTKADSVRENQKEAMKQEVMRAGIPENRIIFTSDDEGGRIGCKELMDLSLQILPEAFKDAFSEAQIVDQVLRIETVKKKREKARIIIESTVSKVKMVAAGAFIDVFMPFHIPDKPLLVAIQKKMVASLAALYGIDPDTVEKFLACSDEMLEGRNRPGPIYCFDPNPWWLRWLSDNPWSRRVSAATQTRTLGWYAQETFEEYAIAKIKNAHIAKSPWNPESFMQFYEQHKKEFDD